MNTTTKLFSDFSATTREQWKAKVIEDLKGADFEKRLVWKTDDQFNIQPFYTSEDVAGNKTLAGNQELFAANGCHWISYVEIKTTDAAKANELAMEMKSFGANGFLFTINGNENIDFHTLLNGLNPDEDHISFSLAKPSLAFATAYFDFLKKSNVKVENVKGFFEADVLEKLCTEGTEPDFATLESIVKLSKTYPGFKALSIQSHAFANAGANTTQELAFTLNKLTDYIDKLSGTLSAKDIVSNISLHMAIGGDYFFEIAKLRALKILLNNILPLYGANAADVNIVSSNSAWSKSSLDPNVNMLRNTTEAMSAILGGCDALLVYPHDDSYNEPTKSSRRTALNISNLLRGESYFDKVADPSAGSYYIETLTANLTEQALTLFKQIEEKGGFINCFKAGTIQADIKKIKDLKEKEIISRKRVYVGSNKFPDLLEKAPVKTMKVAEKQASFPLLTPQHATKPFEELKNKTLVHFEKTGFIPKVYPACFGDLAMRKARSTFAGEFFGTAGFEVLGDNFFDDAVKAAEESATSNTNIVVMCSSDAEYETDAVKFAEKFKSISKDKLLVLAGYPETIIDQLKAAGVDGFIHVRSNPVEVLTDFQQKMGI